MENKEPSNQTLLENMNERFNMVFEQFRKHDGMFVLISQQLGVLLRNEGEFKTRLGEMKESLDEIRETVKVMAKAIDSDALTLVRHEKRITRLEEKTA
jgi:hypothetical protein